MTTYIYISLQEIPLPRNLEALSERSNPGIDSETFLLHTSTLFVKVLQRDSKDLDEFILFKMLFRVLVAFVGEIDLDMDEVKICVTHPFFLSLGSDSKLEIGCMG